MRTGIIYKATSPSGKIYIGQTIMELNKRICGHLSDAKIHNYAFARALRKYGNKIIWEIIYENIQEDQLDKMERWTIANYNAYYNGYNSTAGGDENPMKYSEYRIKISKANKGRKRLDLSKRNSENPMYGERNPASKLNKEKVKEIRIKYFNNNTTLRKLAKEYNVTHRTIWLVIQNKIWKE